MNTAAMNRPMTPNFNFAQQAGPSSPPETPTTSKFTFNSRRNGMHFSHTVPTQNGTINGQGPIFNIPNVRPADLSPRSSSPDSTHSSSSGSPPRSRSPSSEPGEPVPESPPRQHTRIIAEGNFTVEEIRESDYEELGSEDEVQVMRPYHYEDAESDRAPSVRSGRELDPGVVRGFKNLHCDPRDEEDMRYADREAWLEALRAERRRKRRSSGSVQKRTLSQSIGSDTDDEDLQPEHLYDANEVGSSARRLRRKVVVGERSSLIFDDPPARIEELEEPESCEEVVAISENEDGQTVDQELPYYMQMDTDED